MTEPRTCPGYNCGATLRDEFLCKRCVHRAVTQLGKIGELVDELEVTITRQARTSAGGHRQKGDEQPLPYNAKASDDGDAALAFLYDWATFISGQNVGDMARDRRARHAAELISDRATWLANNDQGPTCAHTVSNIVRVLRRLTDRRAERLYAGPCKAKLAAKVTLGFDGAGDETITVSTGEVVTCELDVYREWGKDFIICDGYNDPDGTPGCGTQHSVDGRRDFLIAAVNAGLLPLRIVWDSLHVLVPGCEVPWRTARSWPLGRKIPDPKRPDHHKIIPPRLPLAAKTTDGTKLYRGADILRLAADDMPRPGAKRRRTRTRRTHS